jgi:hypothetical protein
MISLCAGLHGSAIGSKGAMRHIWWVQNRRSTSALYTREVYDWEPRSSAWDAHSNNSNVSLKHWNATTCFFYSSNIKITGLRSVFLSTCGHIYSLHMITSCEHLQPKAQIAPRKSYFVPLPPYPRPVFVANRSPIVQVRRMFQSSFQGCACSTHKLTLSWRCFWWRK